MTPLEYTTLRSRQVRAADLMPDHRDSSVSARLVWDDQVEHLDAGQVCALTVGAVDSTSDLRVVLHLETFRAHDGTRKWVELTNMGARPLTLPRAFGLASQLPMAPGARVHTLSGGWSREFAPAIVDLAIVDLTIVDLTIVDLAIVDLTVGELSLGSQQVLTSHTYSPVTAPTRRDDPDGLVGGAYGVALAWSGSCRMGVDVVSFGERVRVAGGVDDESGVITLLPGESFTSSATLDPAPRYRCRGRPEVSWGGAEVEARFALSRDAGVLVLEPTD